MKKIMLALALLIGTTALKCMDAAQEISHPMLQAIQDGELSLGKIGDNTGGFSYRLQTRPMLAVTSYDFSLTALDATVPLAATITHVQPPNTLNSLYAFISKARTIPDIPWAQECTINTWLTAHKEASLSFLSHKQQVHFKHLETEQEEYAVLFFYALQKKFASK